MGTHRETICPRGHGHAARRKLWSAGSTAHCLPVHVLSYVCFVYPLPLYPAWASPLCGSPSTTNKRAKTNSFPSDPLHGLHARLPHVYPLPHILDMVPACLPGLLASVPAPQLRLDRPPRLQQHEAVPHTDGDLGVRRPGRRAVAGLGRGGKQRGGPQDPARLWLRGRRVPGYGRSAESLARRARGFMGRRLGRGGFPGRGQCG